MSGRTAATLRVVGGELYLLPIVTRVPLKFGPETVTSVVCARAALTVETGAGRRVTGWGETPLSVQWVWPGTLPHEERLGALVDLTGRISKAWVSWRESGHALELGHAFQEGPLRALWREVNATRPEEAKIPWLAALVCSSPQDLALHDACGKACGLPTYSVYGGEHLPTDLAHFLEPAPGSRVSFAGKRPPDFFKLPAPRRLPAWHLVGGKDPVEASELDGTEPDDGYPVLLRDWIRRDGLKCLKVKLRGDDLSRDMARLESVGRVAIEEGCRWLSADFNCTVRDPEYVCEILDRLLQESPEVHARLLYVEQPFPHDLEANRIDVRSVAARKPLFLDESAHDWTLVRLGRELGWSGVALKTCKTQTGALLSLAWARAHGMTIMVQDLTNPMLAQIPHVLLAAHAGTIQGVETNSMQFYPEASAPESRVHPGLYCRREGHVDLGTVAGPGFGYRLEEIERPLPPPVFSTR